MTDTTQVHSGNKLNVIKLDTKSDRVIQEITIANDELWRMCTFSEWYMLGRIGQELHYGNALWYCGNDAQTGKPIKASSSSKKTIASLIRKHLVIPTETTDIYIINPFYLRKGDLIRVLHGTAEQLVNVTKVLPDHIKPIQKPIGVDFTPDRALLGFQ